VLFESTDPLSSKFQFKLKNLKNGVFILGISALFVSLLSLGACYLSLGFMAMLIGDAIVLAGAYFLFTLWDKRPIQIRCPNCCKIVSSSTPWVCKACGVKNMDTVNFPFVNKCEACGVEPKAYRCHHNNCGEMIFFSEDQDETNYASCLNSPREVKTVEPDERTTRLEKYKTDKEEKQHLIDMANLDEQYGEHLKRKEMLKKKSPREEIETDFEIFEAKIMGRENFAAERKALYDEQYKNDQETRERKLLTLDRWLKDGVK
jgi:hypothetical protein